MFFVLLCFMVFFFHFLFFFFVFFFFFSSRRRHTRSLCDWSSDVCSSDLGELTQRQGTTAPRDRRALVRRLDLHVAAQERAFHEIVRAAGVGELGRELWMNRGAVQAFVVILKNQFPVGAHVVLDAPDRAQRREMVAREPPRERTEGPGERLGGGVQ